MGEVAQRIYRTLDENGYGYLVQAMIDKYGVGGTAGEMFLIVCQWLAEMRNKKLTAFDLIKEDAEILFQIGYDIKYFNKDSLNNV